MRSRFFMCTVFRYKELEITTCGFYKDVLRPRTYKTLSSPCHIRKKPINYNISHIMVLDCIGKAGESCGEDTIKAFDLKRCPKKEGVKRLCYILNFNNGSI